MEFDFLRIIGLVSVFLLTSLLIQWHCFVYADKDKYLKEKLKNRSTLYKILYFELIACIGPPLILYLLFLGFLVIIFEGICFIIDTIIGAIKAIKKKGFNN